jgi:predicted amidophosphoribosyltransferase
MATVHELTALYENFMVSPRRGPSVCETCFNLTDGYDHCFACRQNDHALAAMAPISYSVAQEQLHHVLASYKRLTGPVARRLGLDLGALLWRFLESHEQCLATAAGVSEFRLVTTVPSSDQVRDEFHPLRSIVGELVAPTRDRYARLLRPSEYLVPPRAFSLQKFAATGKLSGEPVLLVDDTWTMGASAQSAAATLRGAGSGPVAAVVIGRHLNRPWRENHRRLGSYAEFDWTQCVLCATEATGP